MNKLPAEPHPLENLLREFSFDFFGSGKHKMTTEELFSTRGAVLLDVRSEEEVDVLALGLGLGPALRVIHIPTHEIPDRVHDIPADCPVAVFCTAGIRAAMVYVYLHTLGFDNVRVLSGGLPELVGHALPGAIWKRGQSSGKAS